MVHFYISARNNRIVTDELSPSLQKSRHKSKEETKERTQKSKISANIKVQKAPQVNHHSRREIGPEPDQSIKHDKKGKN